MKNSSVLNLHRRPESGKPYINNFRETTNQDAIFASYLEEFVKKDKASGEKKHNDRSTLLTYHSPYAPQQSFTENEFFKVNKKFAPTPPKKGRPISAPVYKIGAGSWNAFEFSSPSMCSSMNSNVSSLFKMPVYKRQQQVLCVQAAVNGSRNKFFRVTAPNLSKLLMECTRKLCLPSSARKLFLADGTLVIHESQLSKDCEVFVSTGEPFKDLCLSFQEREKIRKASFWTLNGIFLPNSSPKTKHSSLSSRMKDIADFQKRRVLVFKNGFSSNGAEIVANALDDFLDMCTMRLGLNSGARHLFDWNGEIVEDLSQVPSLPKLLQPTSGMVLGPLWVTKGEMFSAKGPLDFMSLMVANTRERLSSSKELMAYLAEVLQNECDHGFVNQEIEKQLKEEFEVAEELENILQMLLQILATIKTLHAEESTVSASTHKFQHISEISSDSRLINGLYSFRIYVYANGKKSNEEKLVVNVRELQKGTKTKAEAIQRFLDFVNCNSNVIKMFELNIRMVSVKRAFLIDGEEVTDLNMLTQDAKVWLSLGETFVPVQYSILSITPEKVKFKNLWGMKKILQKDIWMGSDFSLTKSKLWQISSSIPLQCQTEEVKLPSSFDEQISFLKQSCETRIREKNTFLQFKQDHSLVLFPELTLEVKGFNPENNIWGEKIERWLITKDGHICNRNFPNLLLGMADISIQFTLNDKGDFELLDGAAVMLFDKSCNSHMKWAFTKDGYIQSLDNPSYVLTAVNGFALEPTFNNKDKVESVLSWDISNYNHSIVVTENFRNEERKSALKEIQHTLDSIDGLPDQYDGEKIALVVLPRFPVHHSLASKQRWAIKNEQTQELGRMPKKWERQSLIWPVDESEAYIGDVLEGHLVFDAPQLHWKGFKSGNDQFRVATRIVKPIKIQLLRNGEDKNRSVTIFCPEARIYKPNQSFTKGDGFSGLLEIGFTKFLERCTEVLNLPSAARRLFLPEGKEIFSLSNLNEDDIVYVSCGEVWIDSSASQGDEMAKMALASLIADISKVRQFSLLRKQAGFIVSASDDMSKSSTLRLIEEPTNKQNENENEQQINQEVYNENVSMLKQSISYHQHVCPYKWVYADEFIHLKENPNIVIGINDNQITANQDLVTCKRQIDIPTQRWTLDLDGSIRSKANPQLVVAVSMPVFKSDFNYKSNISVFRDARLIVTNKRFLINGNSNQLFKINDVSGYIQAFATDQVNIEVTASNKAGVCTFAIFGENTITQPGFVWNRSSKDGSIKKLLLCESCGIVIRGSRKLEALNGFTEFSCAMGDAVKNKIKIKGSFQCLNNRIDLSPPECESTLFLCEKLLDLRQEAGTCKTVNKIIQSNPGVRVLAHKNGCNSDGVLVIGSSIQQLLDQCTSRLNLSQSARLLFLMDGELITNMNQILKPYYPELTYIKRGFVQILNEENTSDIERLDVRIPVDVWVSVGEPFIPLQDAEKSKFLLTSKHLAKLQMVNNLQIKKHNLRHTKARRLLEFSSEKNIKPVIIKPLAEDSSKENQIEQSISQLQTQLDEVKLQGGNIQSEPVKKTSKKKLYTLPQALKLFVFQNGENPDLCDVVFARTLQELMASATTKLNLPSCARRVFSKEGVEIFSMDDLKRNQTVCISCGNKFVNYNDKKNMIDLKAKWSRAQKQKILEGMESETVLDEEMENKIQSEEDDEKTIIMTSEEYPTCIEKDATCIEEDATKRTEINKQSPNKKHPTSMRFDLSLRVY